MYNGNIIKALGIERLPDEQKARILDRATLLVQQRLLLRLTKSVPEDKRDDLTEIISSGDSEKLNQFAIEYAPDYMEWMEEEVEQVKEEMRGIAADIDKE